MTDKKGGKYVPIYLEWLDVTQDLTAEEKGNLIDAVVAYASGLEYESLLTGGAKIAFRFLKGQIDRNRELSEKRSKAASGSDDEANGSKTEETGTKEEQNGTNGSKTEQTGTKLPKEKEKEKEEDKEKEKESTKEPPKRFTPPTVEEVAAYCKERGNGIDPEYFVDYQTARNWVLSNGKKMQDWKATIRTWEKNGYSKTGKVVTAQQYGQRDYSGEQEDAMRRMIGQKKVLPAQQFSQRDYSNEDADAINRMLAMADESKTG